MHDLDIVTTRWKSSIPIEIEKMYEDEQNI